MRKSYYSCAMVSMLLIVVLPSFSYAQERSWGDVTANDLAWTTYENDPDAKAVILQDVGLVHFNSDLNLEFERHVRIKILDPDNTDLTDVSILFNRSNRNQTVSGLSAQVFNFNDRGNVERTRLRRRDFHTNRINDNFSERKFTFPNLRPGSIIEYRYRVTSRNATFLRSWSFQSNEPTLYSSFTAHLTSIFQYAQILQGDITLLSVNERQEFSPGTTTVAGAYQGTSGVTYRWVAENMPAVRVEPHMTAPSDYMLTARFQLATILPPGGLPRAVLENWNTLSDDLNRNVYFGRQISANRAIRQQVQVLTEGLTNDQDKARAIYAFVSEEIIWNRRRGILTNEGVRDAFDKRSGSGADKSLLLVTMLREAGIDAHPVLISTRDNGKPIWEYPIISQFNHTIVVARIGNRNILMEPTYRDLPFGVLHPNSLNDQGYVVKSGNLTQVPLPVTQQQRNRHLSLLEIDEAGMLSGSMSARYSGYDAILARAVLRGDDSDKAIRSMVLSNLPDSELIDSTIDNLDDRDEPLIVNVDIASTDYIMAAGDRMYFNPFVQLRFDENPFKMPNRTYPVELNYSYENQLVTTFRIPDGFEVEELPQNREINFTDDTFYRQLFQVDQNGIQLVSTMKMGDNFIPVQFYSQLREFYNLIVDAQSAQIVLRRTVEGNEGGR